MGKPTGNSLPEWTAYVRSGATYDDRVSRLADAPIGIRLLLGPGEDERQVSQEAKPTPPDRLTVVLPWPDKALSPNSRTHWAQRSRVAKGYRWACRVHAKKMLDEAAVQALRQHVTEGGHLDLALNFHPPNGRRRDDDNVIAAFKSGRDGLADALGIDDEHFRIHPVLRRDHPVRRGGVQVVITAGPENHECRKGDELRTEI